MSEKLGLIDSNTEISQLDTYFTNDVQTLLEELWKLMTTCGSDFTNTFRDLSMISKDKGMTEDDIIALEALAVKNTAPKEGLIAAKKSRYSNEETIQKVLDKQPE